MGDNEREYHSHTCKSPCTHIGPQVVFFCGVVRKSRFFGTEKLVSFFLFFTGNDDIAHVVYGSGLTPSNTKWSLVTPWNFRIEPKLLKIANEPAIACLLLFRCITVNTFDRSKERCSKSLESTVSCVNPRSVTYK